jgi:patatin-related protein
MADTQQSSGHDAAELLELRIALVCYGGVSLAIYMHGITKELQSLLRASRAFDQAFGESTAEGTEDLTQSPLRPTSGTEAAYFDQLVELHRAGVPVSATIDVIGGTSAGGINGICLAKAIVHDASQDELTKLWMRRGDIGQLMRFGRFGVRLGGLLNAVGLPAHARKAWAPLKGDDMSRWLYGALEHMDRNPGEGSLLPRDGTLDLHVTATDVRGTERVIPLGTGQSLHDHTHRRVFTFVHRPGDEDTIGRDKGTMAYAARATSSFPGAFAPVSLEQFARSVNGGRTAFAPKEVAEHHLPEYAHLPGPSPVSVPMMDGGVLANAPFDPVVASIATKPARRQVSRHLLFIEPDPTSASAGATPDQVRETAGELGDQPPTWAGTLWAAQTIRGQQSLTTAIERLGELNEHAVTLGKVIASLRDDVDGLLSSKVDPALASAPELSFDQLAEHGDQVHSSVPDVVGALNYRVYCRLKVAGVSQRLADDLAEHLSYPKTSPEASFLRAALLAWAQAWEKVEAPDQQTEQMNQWLSGLDAPYRERRLEFLIDGVNRLFRKSAAGGEPTHGPTRAQLSAVKESAWALLVDERAKPARAVALLGDEAAFASRAALAEVALDGDAQAWALAHGEQIKGLVEAYRGHLGALAADSARNLWDAFTDTTASWPQEARRGLASRYVGFPLWDALLYPAQSMSQLAMYNPIRVSRVSPVDAEALQAAVEGPKLLGVSIHHFGAFFALARRENDYLWGRLDGVELLLRLLREQHPRPDELGGSAEVQREAFGTVLDEEATRLREGEVQDLIRRVRDAIPQADVPAASARAE